MHKGDDNVGQYENQRSNEIALLSAIELTARMPSAPFAARHSGCSDVQVQAYRHPSGAVETPGNADHLLVLHLAGLAHIEDVTAGQHRRATASAGCFSLTPAGYPVSRAWTGDPEVVLLYLRPGLIDQVAQEMGLRAASVELLCALGQRDPQLELYGALLRAAAMESDNGSPLKVEYLARALAIHLLEAHSNMAGSKPLIRPEAIETSRLDDAVEYMRANLDQPVTLGELASVCRLSVTHFGRAFRQKMGLAPHAFLVNLRVQKAIELLEGSDMSIMEVAISCGFDQPQYFATVFRRKLGCSPSMWRQARTASKK